MTPSPIASEKLSHTRGLALFAACSAGFFWGTGALVVDLLVRRYGFTPENISFWRFAIGAVVLLVFFGRTMAWANVWRLAWRLIIAGVAMAGYVLCWFLGIERIGAAVPTLIALCLPPVLVTMIAVFRGQEKLDRQLLCVLSMAIVGTVLVVSHHGSGASSDTQNMVIGILFSLGSAFLYTGFSLVSGKLSTDLGAGQSATCLTIIAAAAMALFGLIRPLSWPEGIPPQAWYLYLGIITAALALLAYSWGAARLSPTALTVATLVEPLTAVILSALILGSQMTSLQWLGGAFLMWSIWILGRRVTA
jgi:drug/metabolite transporter, DME family